MGYYQFKPDDARNFARFINIPTSEKGDELRFTVCPFCKADARKDKLKFSINLETGAYKCFRASCGAHGHFFQLARQYGFKISDDVERYYNTNFKQYKTYTIKHRESTDPAVRYCASRGISEEVCRKYEITTQKEHDNILVMMFREPKTNEVSFIKYRKTDFNKDVDNNKEWSESNGKAILFGMNHCDPSIDTLVLTEGQMDSLALATAGIPNPVSVPTGANGATWIPHCWDFVKQFKQLVVFGDCEKGHITLVDMVRDRFPDVLVKVVQESDYCGCKDANEILQTYGAEQLRIAVENAQALPVAQVIDYTAVERVNILEMEALPTKISKLDEILTKGFFYGQTILLTGYRGDGKSTLLQQIIARAIDQNVKTFLYSGELPNYVIRNFTDTMLADKHESEIRDDMARVMSEVYRDTLYLYDSSNIEVDEKEDLLVIVERMIKQYGCRFICLDNLMTVLEAVDNDALYRAQSAFIGKLVKIAKAYNVIVVIVAHPRKHASAILKSEFQADDIAGSSDITNKVDVIISYQRCKLDKDGEADDSLREIWVLKNRLTGKLAIGKNAIPVKYEAGTRRITGVEGSFRWRCRWMDVYENNPMLPTNEWSRDYSQTELPF